MARKQNKISIADIKRLIDKVDDQYVQDAIMSLALRNSGDLFSSLTISGIGKKRLRRLETIGYQLQLSASNLQDERRITGAFLVRVVNSVIESQQASKHSRINKSELLGKKERKPEIADSPLVKKLLTINDEKLFSKRPKSTNASPELKLLDTTPRKLLVINDDFLFGKSTKQAEIIGSSQENSLERGLLKTDNEKLFKDVQTLVEK